MRVGLWRLLVKPIGSNANPTAEAGNEGEEIASHPADSPYEEMMVRFQIRHLQRSASVHSEDRRGGHNGGSDPSVGTSTPDRELGRLSSSRMSDRMSSLPDNGGRSASYQRLASLNTSRAGDHPPLQSGTSSAQLAEQFNLAFESDDLAGREESLHVNGKQGRRLGGPWIHFLLDVLSAERLAFVARFVRMIWLMRLNHSGSGHNFWAWLLYSRYSHLICIAGIITMLICIAHYIACVWTVLLEESDGETLPW